MDVPARFLGIFSAAVWLALGCASGTAPVSEASMSFEEAMGLCRQYCNNPQGERCQAFELSRCYRSCMGTYQSRTMSNCPPSLKCDRRGYCLEESLRAYFGCAPSEDCDNPEGSCDEAMLALEECEALWDVETPAWCEENCATGCEGGPYFGRWCYVPCERDADCSPGSHCNVERGQCSAQCEWRRAPDDGSRVPVFCQAGATCDNRGCCQPRSGFSRAETRSYCDPP